MENKAEKDYTVLWWIGWITLTILSFFVSYSFWTGFIAKHVGPMDQKGVPLIWVAAVFGTWMVLLVPLIILMYNKVDRSYEDARIKRDGDNQKKIISNLGFKIMRSPVEGRLLPKEIQKKLKKMPRTLNQGQLVALKFENGKRLENVFVLAHEEIVGIYDADWKFDAKNVVDVEILDPGKTMPVEHEKWMRLAD